MSSEESSPEKPSSPPLPPLAPPPEPVAGPSRIKYRLRYRFTDKALREKKARSYTLPRRRIPVPFAGYYSDSDANPLNLARRRTRPRRRCYSIGSYFGDPDMGGISPIGSEGEFRSYSSSRAVSIQDVAPLNEIELDNDVFYEDGHQMRILNERLTWDNFLGEFNMQHLTRRFERARVEIGDIFHMTFVDFRSYGIREMRDLGSLRKIIMLYTDRKFDSF